MQHNGDWNRPGSKPGDYWPAHIGPAVMRNGSACFGDGGIKQVGAYSNRWGIAEHQQKRRHQRAAAHSGEANCKTNGGARKNM